MAEKVVYKVVCALLGLAAIPLAIFNPIIRIVGDISVTKTYVGEDVSFRDIYELFFAKGSTFSGFGDFKLTDPVRATMPALIASGVFLALAILFGLAGAVIAVGTRKKLPVLLLSAGSMLCIIGMFIAFNRFFAAPYVDGTISIADLGFIEEGILESIFSSLMHLELLKISSAGFLLLGLYSASFLWTGAYMFVELGEPKDKEKKKKKA